MSSAPTAALPGAATQMPTQVRAPATAGPCLVGAVTVALAAAGAFPWLPRHLIRAIIRLGLQDGAGRALPPLAQGGVGAGFPDHRLSGRSCPASGADSAQVFSG